MFFRPPVLSSFDDGTEGLPSTSNVCHTVLVGYIMLLRYTGVIRTSQGVCHGIYIYTAGLGTGPASSGGEQVLAGSLSWQMKHVPAFSRTMANYVRPTETRHRTLETQRNVHMRRERTIYQYSSILYTPVPPYICVRIFDFSSSVHQP